MVNVNAELSLPKDSSSTTRQGDKLGKAMVRSIQIVNLDQKYMSGVVLLVLHHEALYHNGVLHTFS